MKAKPKRFYIEDSIQETTDEVREELKWEQEEQEQEQPSIENIPFSKNKEAGFFLIQ